MDLPTTARTLRNWHFSQLAILVLILAVGCKGRKPAPVTPAPVEKPTSRFVDRTSEAGIDFQMSLLPNEQGANFKINLYDHGCGVAVGDYDGDGDDDIYLLNQLGANALYQNNGDGTFTDVTEQQGVGLDDRVSVGATFSDYDNDGDQDLFVTSTRGGNVLFRNEGDDGLVDRTDEVGLTHVGHSQTAAFFDYDNDGLLDLFIAQTAEWTQDTYDEVARYYVGKGEPGGGLGQIVKSPKESNLLYQNNGDGTFTNVTESSGLAGRGWSGDAAVFDYDEDGWQDIVVASMFGRAQLYRNNQDGTFTDVTIETLGRTPFGGIGVNVFDFDNDGHLDIYIVDMHSDMWMGLDFDQASLPTARESEKVKFDYFFGPMVDRDPVYKEYEAELDNDLQFDRDEVLFGNAFYRNLGDGKFEEISDVNGLETFWPWSVAPGDFDNDGFVDVFVASGMGYPFYYWPNQLLMNTGDGAFQERALALSVEPPASGRLLDAKIEDRDCVRSSRCAATADFDGDGRLELIVNNFNHEPYYLSNQLTSGNYVALQLVGTKSSRDAIGAIVQLKAGDLTLTRQVSAASGYLSHSSKQLHFGLGDATADSVTIRWPSGVEQSIEDVETNQRTVIEEPES